MAITDAQIGVLGESSYGTTATVSRFFEFNTETIKGSYGRVESAALRAGTKVMRADRFAVNPKGATGDIELEVQSKGFGFWLAHMLGTVATGTTTDSVTTHTATVGPLDGKSFTAQVGRPDTTGAVRPYTYSGGKLTGWELKNAVDGLLLATLNGVFATENVPTGSDTGANALQTASYPATTPAPCEIFAFTGATFQIAGTTVPLKDFSLKATNGLKVDRFFIRSNGTMLEPLEEGFRAYELSVTTQFDGLTQVQRVSSATAAGAVAAVTATWTSPSLVGTSTRASVTVTLPAVRFDTDPLANINGAKIPDLKLAGKALTPTAGGSAVSIAYATADATP
jgi:hypothetical protein